MPHNIWNPLKARSLNRVAELRTCLPQATALTVTDNTFTMKRFKNKRRRGVPQVYESGYDFLPYMHAVLVAMVHADSPASLALNTHDG